eukprot:CAMPEP_0202691314 /NCGR_PEP_ID=MMETSP1385-20130828/6063_1 /ASSEMBLY_ACC=CAM_ASM_000861 /TAXON_ID=933848 /ORGANISM="Elphidium margaritaceum" /LENGTH=836 /DNA_ID=CAMNT_0049346699 /DNA_START=32 /DNA_END=2542 /DNA_ORIENTATION=+
MAVNIAQSATRIEEPLCFDRHLRHAFTPVTVRLQHGLKALDGVIEMLRLRIEAEAQFAAALQRIMNNESLIHNLPSSESLRKDGMDAIHADMKNEYTQRVEYVNSLTEDVYQPCLAMRDLYASKNRSFAHETKENIKQLRQHQSVFHKTKAKYEKVCRDASIARTSLLRAKSDTKISSQQILKLGNKVNSTLKTQQSWKERYEQGALEWHREQIRFDDQMTGMLQGMQSNEANRMANIQDSLNKWAVFTTNLCANRNYDCKSLAESMALMDPSRDLQLFMQQTLAAYPSQTPNGQIPPHHALHYGKDQKDALVHLNKTSTEKASKHVQGQGSMVSMDALEKGVSAPLQLGLTAAASSSSPRSMSKSLGKGSSVGGGTGGHGRNTSFSFSSYNPSIPNRAQSFAADSQTATTATALSLGNLNGNVNGSGRRPSRSYSTSEQHSIGQGAYDYSKRQNRQNATPNSIGGFFKQKFQKQQSYTNSQNNHLSHEHMHEHSHTLSSYNGGSGVYPPMDDETAQSPKARSRNEIEHDPEIPPMDKTTSADSNNPATVTATNTRQRSLSKKKKLSKPQRRYSQQAKNASPRKKQNLKQSNQPMSSFPESPQRQSPKTQANYTIATTPKTPDLRDMINQNQSPKTEPLTPLTPPTTEPEPEPMTLAKSHSPRTPKITMNFGPRHNQSKPVSMVIIKRSRSKSPSPPSPATNNTQNIQSQQQHNSDTSNNNNHNHIHNNNNVTTIATAEEIIANRRRGFTTEEEREHSTPELSPTTTPILAPASTVIGNTQMSQIQSLSITSANNAVKKQSQGDTPLPEQKKKTKSKMGAATYFSESDDDEVDPLD